jgi:hypothetical protein
VGTRFLCQDGVHWDVIGTRSEIQSNFTWSFASLSIVAQEQHMFLQSLLAFVECGSGTTCVPAESPPSHLHLPRHQMSTEHACRYILLRPPMLKLCGCMFEGHGRMHYMRQPANICGGAGPKPRTCCFVGGVSGHRGLDMNKHCYLRPPSPPSLPQTQNMILFLATPSIPKVIKSENILYLSIPSPPPQASPN